MDNSNEEFKKIISDFTQDLLNTFPELKSTFNNFDYDACFLYCKEHYPENFFNILYENNELFEKEETKYLLPNIDFSKIMNDETLSEASKKTIWKYLQLILFSVCNTMKDKDDFGNANMLFEAINENDLHNKIEETMNEMKNVFLNMNKDCSNDEQPNMDKMFETMMNDMSGVDSMFSDMSNQKDSFNNMFDAEKMKSHISGIMGGKIGNLAKEIAEEASKELGLDASSNIDEKSQQNFLKELFKNPGKIMNIVKSIGTKLEEKFKSGELKESELMEEAQDIMGKMKDMPGLKEMMSSMGMNPGGKFDFKGMANKMQQNMKQAKTKERMKAKLEKNKEKQRNNEDQDLGTLTNIDEDTFIWNDSNSNPNEPLTKSSSKSSNLKSSKKKKNKGKKKKN